MLIPHLNPLLDAYTALLKARNNSFSVIATSWVLGLTNFSKTSEDKYSAKLYQRSLFEGIVDGSPILLKASAFYEQRKEYLSILELSSFDANLESLTHISACN